MMWVQQAWFADRPVRWDLFWLFAPVLVGMGLVFGALQWWEMGRNPPPARAHLLARRLAPLPKD